MFSKFRTAAMVYSIFLSFSLLNAVVLVVTNLEELKQIINSNENVIVEFYSPRCPHCRPAAPRFENFSNANDVAGKIVCVKVDVYAHPEFARPYGISGYPTFIFFRNGKKKFVHLGAGSALETTLTQLAQTHFN